MVVEHWQNVFRITHLALCGSLVSPCRLLSHADILHRADPIQLASLEEKKIPVVTQDELTGESTTEMVLPEGSLPDKLVRIPIGLVEGSED